MEDPAENAAVVNALQRRADIVVQKSLAVAEAMWKARPVVASGIGGICDQIEDGVSGAVVDPRDPPGFGALVTALLNEPGVADRMGAAARERVRTHFLVSRHLRQYFDLVARMLQSR